MLMRCVCADFACGPELEGPCEAGVAGVNAVIASESRYGPGAGYSPGGDRGAPVSPGAISTIFATAVDLVSRRKIFFRSDTTGRRGDWNCLLKVV